MCKWCIGRCALIFVFLCFLSGISALRIRRELVDESVQSYLSRFGYMKNSGDVAFAIRTEESVREAIRELQEFAGIPVSGRVDARTKQLLRTPRCGLPDKLSPGGSFIVKRSKRFAVHSMKWPFTNLTWSLRTRRFDDLNSFEVRSVISQALAVWSKHSKLEFTEVDSDRADILIYFHRGSHGDKFPFDGKGVVLAHAFFPNNLGSSVDVHFDADESWTTSSSSRGGTNLFNVAAHEIGHALGILHSNKEEALMYPWYKEISNGDDYELPEDDRLAIQSLYGAREERLWEPIYPYRPYRTSTTSTTTTTMPPRTRPTHRPKVPYTPPYNGFPTYPNQFPGTESTFYPKIPTRPKPYYPKHEGKPYDPKRKHHRRPPHTPKYHDRYPRPSPTPLYPEEHHPERHYPSRKNPSKENPGWKPPPDTCNTSYDAVAIIRREVFIFKDAYFWRIGDRGLLPNYPAEISRLWRQLPKNLTHVDAVYERQDGKIVFFIGKLHYVFSGDHLEPGYPKPLTELGLPEYLDKVDGAMVWGHNGKTYFYSGSQFWRYDDEVKKVELDYPRDIKKWKGVGRNIDAVFQWKDGKTYFFKGKGFWKFNDMNMTVEDPEQKLSAPFWMGCTDNFEDRKVGQKLPYVHTTSSSSRTDLSLTLLVSLMLIYSFNEGMMHFYNYSF